MYYGNMHVKGWEETEFGPFSLERLGLDIINLWKMAVVKIPPFYQKGKRLSMLPKQNLLWASSITNHKIAKIAFTALWKMVPLEIVVNILHTDVIVSLVPNDWRYQILPYS